MKNKRSFLLLEVVLTIALLSLGLVFIIRSISICMNTSRESFNYSQAINLAYEKAFELELISQKDCLEIGCWDGNFSDRHNFNWKYSLKETEDKNLAKLILEIYWRERKIKKGLYLETYVRKKCL